MCEFPKPWEQLLLGQKTFLKKDLPKKWGPGINIRKVSLLKALEEKTSRQNTQVSLPYSLNEDEQFHYSLHQAANRPDEKSSETDWNRDSKQKTLLPYACLSSSICSSWRSKIKPGEAGQPRKHFPASVPARALGHTDWRQQRRWGFITTVYGGVPMICMSSFHKYSVPLLGIFWNTALCADNR